MVQRILPFLIELVERQKNKIIIIIKSSIVINGKFQVPTHSYVHTLMGQRKNVLGHL
jgi:hypothetical protein